ncbi:MAG: DUF5106 domain-containing protein [Bacteroidales bacterium]|nr:DUF5106 domain-containing protein [Bacteroidales bacterium]
MNQVHSFKGVYLTMALSCLLMVSCGSKGQKPQTLDKQAKVFTIPAIPAVITNPAEIADYLAVRFWDHFDFSDSTSVDTPEYAEQAFVDYIDIFPHVSEQALKSSIGKTLEKALVDSKMFTYFVGLFEKYLYDPNSPMRNEEFYAIAIEYIIASQQIDEIDKVRPQFQLEQVNKNRKGTMAADFTYTLPNGKQESMYKIKTEFLILFFNNPGCAACADYQQGLVYSPVISQMLDTGRLKILAMYVDEDLGEWEKYRPSVPALWINGYDASLAIRGMDLYDLRAIPSLYLLDKDKRVMLKDVLPHQIEEQLLYALQNY